MNNGLPGPSTTDTITGGKTQELSAYDRVRKPHRRVIDASTMVAIGPRTLSAELTCPICLDLLTNTMTTKECLHRFCEECIKNALMRGNKECPTCRNKIVSKRSLRHDTNFDALISKIWPDRREYERMQEASLRIFQEQSNIGALQQSIEAGMKAQAATRRMRVQGSYDYEKRKRRVGPMATNGAGVSGIAALTVDGADEGGGARDDDAELAISEPSDSDGSSDSSGTSSESRMSDERSAASALSSASEARMAVVDAPAASRAPKASARRQPVVKPPSTSSSLNDKMSKWMKDNAKCNSPAVDDGLDDASPSSSSKNFDPRLLEMRRKGELIDILLAPAKSMLCRANSNGEANSALPLEMLKPLFVRLPPDITVEHVGDYLYQMALKHSAGNSPLSVESAKPSYFYILNHNNQVRKIFLHEALYSAFITAQLTDNYVRLFYDTQPPDVHSAGRLVTEIVSDELATQTA